MFWVVGLSGVCGKTLVALPHNRERERERELHLRADVMHLTVHNYTITQSGGDRTDH